MSRVCITGTRFHFCTVVVVAGFLVICARLYFLQVLEAETIAAEGHSVRKRLVPMEPKRGDILDRNGTLLAGTRSRILLGADPAVVDLEETEKLALLAGMLDVGFSSLKAKLAPRERDGRPVRWVPLAEIGEDLYASVEAVGLEGVYGNRRYHRYYPGKEMAAHLIGFINKEQVPVMGVERALNYYLEGQRGWLETEVDGQRREMAAFRERKVEARDGLHVRLSIDLFVQSVIEDALDELVDEMEPEGASIIVSDPASGEILGLANHPTFDPNSFWDYPLGNQRNRVVSDQYEPGSTFKIVPVAAALEEGLVDADSLIDCSRERVFFNGVNIPMPRDHRDLGTIPVRTVVSKSSNRGAAQLGMLLGEKRLFAYADRFGFGKESGWPLGGEAGGDLPEVEAWDGYTISRLPTGYAVGATPMQVHLAMATLANDGVWIKPRLLEAILDRENVKVLDLEPEKRERVVSKETARLMKRMLSGVAGPEGTARRAAIPGYAVAGKTGTSRKIMEGRYSSRHHVASFSGFFPASEPEVVITVVVDEAKIAGPAYGGLVAAPVFRGIGEQLIPHLGIRKPEEWEPFIVSND
ncbi:MAG: penicillin-binding protein 2 [Oceanipulchritudo sp.]